ncbi:AAA family ATPase [Paenibacillus mendelii]|uniref:AAA family ATPase n=1 Tax=Paenibacillus mendelii TaxID=206163 RepID=A0ABV6JFG5_9BACL|nr:AAA family ATPase [Paenibacillus mendelii]MCQ6557542.1 AAA family ATPase [Paenibacillus mendelii]
MIIWINGAFGSGKTQTAYELHRRLPDSIVFDPENAGYFIRKNIPKAIAEDDFQNYTMWREINYSMLTYLYREYEGTILVPMSIVNPQIFDELIGKLRNDNVNVHHFTLWASRDVLQRRLRSRGEGKHSWAVQQIDRCMAGLSDDRFKPHLETDPLTTPEVAETIARLLGLDLQPDDRGLVRKAFDRLITQVRHIRFFN